MNTPTGGIDLEPVRALLAKTVANHGKIVAANWLYEEITERPGDFLLRVSVHVHGGAVGELPILGSIT